MSTPNEFPDSEHGGGQPNSPPPPGYGSQPDPQAAPHPQPPYQGGQAPHGDLRFELPKDMPRSVQDVMPVGGLSGIFRTDGLPQLLKVSYIMWLVTAAIWLFFTFFSFIGSLFGLASRNYRGQALMGIALAIISVALIAAIVVCAMKLKEGRQWARMALSAIVVVGFIFMVMGSNRGSLLGLVAAVLMWLPESTAWLNSRSKGLSG